MLQVNAGPAIAAAQGLAAQRSGQQRQRMGALADFGQSLGAVGGMMKQNREEEQARASFKAMAKAAGVDPAIVDQTEDPRALAQMTRDAIAQRQQSEQFAHSETLQRQGFEHAEAQDAARAKREDAYHGFGEGGYDPSRDPAYRRDQAKTADERAYGEKREAALAESIGRLTTPSWRPQGFVGLPMSEPSRADVLSRFDPTKDRADALRFALGSLPSPVEPESDLDRARAEEARANAERLRRAPVEKPAEWKPMTREEKVQFARDIAAARGGASDDGELRRINDMLVTRRGKIRLVDELRRDLANLGPNQASGATGAPIRELIKTLQEEIEKMPTDAAAPAGGRSYSGLSDEEFLGGR